MNHLTASSPSASVARDGGGRAPYAMLCNEWPPSAEVLKAVGVQRIEPE